MSLSSPFFMTVALASIRVGVALFALQPISMLRVPRMARAVLAISLGACLALSTSGPVLPALGLQGMVVAVLREVLIGLALAFGVVVAFAAFSVGGRLLDYQVGFGIAQLLDPATRVGGPLFGFLLQLLGAALFLSLDGHHGVLRALAASWVSAPPGELTLAVQPLQLAASFSGAFAYGLAVLAPVVALLALVDLGLAVLSRALPQMNMLLMSLGLKALVAVAAMALSMRFAGGALLQALGAATTGIQ